MLSRILRFFRPRPPEVIVVPQALHAPLTARERVEIDDWFRHPITAKVLALMEARHPGVGMPGDLTRPVSPHDAQHAVTYIARVRGWELYRNQLLALTATPKANADIPESYPNQ
jgi:hypothetical protein